MSSLIRKTATAILLGLTVALSAAQAAPGDALPLDKLKLPPGFSIELLARVPNARQMALGEAGGGQVLFVGTRGEGKVYGLELGRDYQPGALHVLAQGLTMPVGVAYREGSLYISALSRILRLDNLAAGLNRPVKPVVVVSDLPTEAHHGWKFIAFGPDGLLYVPVGAPCNVCERDPALYATILRMKPDGTQRETYARGVRNTVGFDWQPGTNELWFTDNGRDMMGDDVPPDELNRAQRQGQHFGFPYCHGGTVKDPEFGAKRACSEFTAPAQALGAHVAALGMRFYGGAQFPAAFQGRVFIAEHGSWNRTSKSGYRVTTVKLEAGRAVAYEPFITGWLQGERAWGRPADVMVLPDGSLLISDDLAGAIYRVRYQTP